MNFILLLTSLSLIKPDPVISQDVRNRFTEVTHTGSVTLSEKSRSWATVFSGKVLLNVEDVELTQ